MTRKQLETMREVRLWLVQIGVPVAGVCAWWLSKPENREKAEAFVDKAKEKAKTIFKKKDGAQ